MKRFILRCHGGRLLLAAIGAFVLFTFPAKSSAQDPVIIPPPPVIVHSPVPAVPFSGASYSFYPPTYAQSYYVAPAPPPVVVVRQPILRRTVIRPVVGPYYYTPTYPYVPAYYGYYYTPGFFRY